MYMSVRKVYVCSYIYVVALYPAGGKERLLLVRHVRNFRKLDTLLSFVLSFHTCTSIHDLSNNSDGGRRWNTFSPLFRANMNCMEKSDYKLYLYHSDSGNHYDRVIPKPE